jgi:hypothetical protein
MNGCSVVYDDMRVLLTVGAVNGISIGMVHHDRAEALIPDARRTAAKSHNLPRDRMRKLQLVGM